jgi:hypothetical protein
LPAGFPLADEIHQPVRLAGFFFKKWRYDSRSPRGTGSGPLEFEPTAAPLLIAKISHRQQPEDDASRQWVQWLFGGVFVALMALICLGVSWWSWTDRQFARRIRQSDRPDEPIHPPTSH